MIVNKKKYQKIYLITGAAGFIGFHLSKRLLADQQNLIIGLDNLNNYYSVHLKKARLAILKKHSNFIFYKQDLTNKNFLIKLFDQYQFTVVINLAAQAGVRYSLINPDSYLKSNLIGFYNLLEACKQFPPQHLLFASSSSVYGNNNKVPFTVSDQTDQPLNLYAATKKSNELLAYAYNHLFNFPITGMQFFTVYGPYGRPDMSYFSFTEKIAHNQPLTVYNQGNMWRGFTYIDDVVEAIFRLINQSSALKNQTFKVYNIGNHHSEKLIDLISILETNLNKKAKVNFVPAPNTEMERTYADINDLIQDTGFSPQTSLANGLEKFVDWWKKYETYQKN